jgi:flagellin-like hook-associated protein FlgL
MLDASQTTEIFLSEIRDLDYAEAVTRMESALTQLQASMQTSSVLFNLSLLDYLA